MADMWNVIDFITNALYVATIALRIVAYYQVSTGVVWPCAGGLCVLVRVEIVIVVVRR